MNVTSLLTAGLETALNNILYRDRALRAARQRLRGKSLRIELAEMRQPVIFIFNDDRLDILTAWQAVPDCTVKTRLSVLPQLRDRQQITTLIRNEALDVTGDIQIVQQFSALLDLAELDPAEYLSPWTGDVIAQGLSQLGKRGVQLLRDNWQRRQRYSGQILTEEWRIAPGTLEVVCFIEEAAELERCLAALELRFSKLEAQ